MTSIDDRTFAVLMAGGSGTRFWPLSRRRRPKQVLPIAGDRPMIRATVDRLDGLVPPGRTLVVTGADQAPAIAAALQEIPESNYLLEPAPRNTAPCLGLAAVVAARREPEAVLLCLPADQVIEDVASFAGDARVALARADEAATLLTFGIEPDRPATGYGYILLGEEAAPRIRRAGRFREKPNLEKAQGYLAAGGYRWNSGMFAWRADAFLEEVRRYLPDLGAGLDEIAGDPMSIDEVFPRLPAISVDYGVMEKSERVEVVEARFDWDDVGSFEALSRILAADGDGNYACADFAAVDSRRVIAAGREGHLIAALGVEDLIVVADEDVTLVCPRDRAEDIGEMIDELRRRGREDVL